MRAAVRTELWKIATVPGQRTGVLVAVLTLPLFSLLVVTTGGLGTRDTVVSGTATGTVIALVAFGAWAAAVAASEYAHRTLSVSLALVPDRRRLYAAKLVAVAGVAGLGAVTSTLLAWALVAAATPEGTGEGRVPALLGIVLAIVVVSLIGVGLGCATRSPTAAIGLTAAVVLLPKAAGGLLGGLERWVVGASPGSVVTQLVDGAQLGRQETFPAGTAAAVLTLCAVTAAIALGAGAGFLRRDG
jgi:hypothetical protein